MSTRDTSRPTYEALNGDPRLHAAIEQALSRAPDVAVPTDFAARVARGAAALTQVRRRGWLGWGPRTALASAVPLVAGLFALAPHATPSLSNMRFDTELLLLAELGALLLFSGEFLARR